MTDNQRQRINHIATLPRRRHQNKSNGDSLTRSINDDHYRTSSPEDTTTSRTNEVLESVRDKHHTDIGEDQTDYDDPGLTYPRIQQTTSPTTGQSEYHSVGLEALEALHNQLQILVIQDGDSDMADTMHENVEESLRKQISELQESLSEFQTTEQNLRLSLKMAEQRAQEAETKLHHSSQRGLKMEENYYRLEKEYHILHHHYSILEKHLQKQAVLHQMQLSPSKKRPNSATHHRHNKSFDSSCIPQFGSHPVKRHNSSEFLSHHQRQKKKGSVDCSYATADINPCSTLPTRLHSGSLSHTETRV